MLTIREASADDAPAVSTVHARSARELGAEAYDDEQVAAWGRRTDPEEYPVDEPGVHFVVAERAGRVVGFGDARAEPPDYADGVDGEVRAVYVHPDAAREGIGSAILAHLEGWVRGRGVGSLGLHASLNAVPFYEANGYDRIGERSHEFEGGVEATVVEMHKRL